MKKSLLICFCFIQMLFISGGTMAANRIVSLKIQNMTCSVCPLTVKKALSEVLGVLKIEIDYESKVATVQFDDAISAVEKLTDATKNAGYPSTAQQLQ